MIDPSQSAPLGCNGTQGAYSLVVQTQSATVERHPPTVERHAHEPAHLRRLGQQQQLVKVELRVVKAGAHLQSTYCARAMRCRQECIQCTSIGGAQS
eukprot:scaffold66053_cov68-Phaeocystis_antarctica.AAC.3